MWLCSKFAIWNKWQSKQECSIPTEDSYSDLLKETV